MLIIWSIWSGPYVILFYVSILKKVLIVCIHTYIGRCILQYIRALHNIASNSADLSIALMTKTSWKFLHNAESWLSTDKKTCTALKSWINDDEITCTALKPWINAGKHWNMNSSDFAQHFIFAGPKAALCKALLYRQLDIFCCSS